MGVERRTRAVGRLHQERQPAGRAVRRPAHPAAAHHHALAVVRHYALAVVRHHALAVVRHHALAVVRHRALGEVTYREHHVAVHPPARVQHFHVAPERLRSKVPVEWILNAQVAAQPGRLAEVHPGFLVALFLAFLASSHQGVHRVWGAHRMAGES